VRRFRRNGGSNGHQTEPNGTGNGHGTGHHDGGGLAAGNGHTAVVFPRPDDRPAIRGGRRDLRWGTWIDGAFPETTPSTRTLRRDAAYKRTLAAADVLAAGLALVLTLGVIGTDKLHPVALLAAPIIVLTGKILGLYDRDEHLIRKSTLDEAPGLFQVATLFTLVLWLSGSFAIEGEIGRGQAAGLWISLFLFMLFARFFARRLVRRFVSAERCLLLGDPVAAARLRSTLERSSAKAELVAELPLSVGRRKGEVPPEHAPETPLAECIALHDVDRVIIAPTSSDSDEVLDAIRLVKAMGVRVSVLPRLFEAVGSSARWDSVDGVTLLGVPGYGLSNSSRFLKRSMDIVGSALGLVVLAPLLGLIAFAIKLTSSGPVFFRQTRIGKHGQEFQMIKFRSMYDGADEMKAGLLELNEADGLFKIEHDPRVTPVGRMLRRLSLDELPQLFNVLAGHMSLVGPRPLVPSEDRQAEGWQRRRLHVPMGMTGPWQSLGSTRIPFREMVMLDYVYGASWSVWSDVKILVRTAMLVFRRDGM
jgi:exopolysaccharide biosynthesis polyprenyl glycosylphosphotransferase